MRRVAVSLALLSLLATGCEQNAVLEITLDLPPRPTGEFPTEEEVYAFVQIRDDQLPFGDGWAREPRDYAGTRLTDERQEVRYSAVSSRDDIGLHMKVRFCSGTGPQAPFCGSEDESSCTMSRAVWLELERPFYLGKRTAWRDGEAIPEVPAAECPDDRPVQVVGKCEIEGCIEAIPGSGTFCRRSDGTHFCE